MDLPYQRRWKTFPDDTGAFELTGEDSGRFIKMMMRYDILPRWAMVSYDYFKPTISFYGLPPVYRPFVAKSAKGEGAIEGEKEKGREAEALKSTAMDEATDEEEKKDIGDDHDKEQTRNERPTDADRKRGDVEEDSITADGTEVESNDGVSLGNDQGDPMDTSERENEAMEESVPMDVERKAAQHEDNAEMEVDGGEQTTGEKQSMKAERKEGTAMVAEKDEKCISMSKKEKDADLKDLFEKHTRSSPSYDDECDSSKPTALAAPSLASNSSAATTSSISPSSSTANDQREEGEEPSLHSSLFHRLETQPITAAFADPAREMHRLQLIAAFEEMYNEVGQLDVASRTSSSAFQSGASVFTVSCRSINTCGCFVYVRLCGCVLLSSFGMVGV